MNTKRKNNTSSLSHDEEIKFYRLQINELVKEFDWVDAATQMDYDLAIHSLAKRMNNAKQKFFFSKN